MNEKVKKKIFTKKIKSGTVDMTVGSETRNIVNFAIPLLIGNLFQMLYSWTDAIVVGQAINPNAFGSITAASPVVNLLLNVVLGFVTGAAIIIGQLFGKRDYTGLRKSISTTIIVMIFGTVILTISGLFLAEPLLKLMAVSDAQIGASIDYLTIYFLGCGCMIFYNVFAQIIRSVGNSKVPLIMLIVGAITNVVLDILFVVIFKMGVAGTAIATVISQGLSALLCFIYIQLKFPLLRLSKTDFCFSKDYFNSIMRIAIPSMVQQFCASVGYMLINRLINGNGPEFTTAFGVGNRIDELISIQLFSFGIALSTFAAQNKGKNQIKRIRKSLRITLLISASIIIVGGLLILVFRDWFMSLFINMDIPAEGVNIDEIRRITEQFLFIYVPSYLIMEVMIIVSSLLRGVGDALTAMSVNIVSLIARVAAAFLFNYWWGYIGVFFASPFGWAVGALWATLRYFKGNWSKIDSFANIKASKLLSEQLTTLDEEVVVEK